MMWKKQKSKRAISDSNEAFSLFDKSNKKGSSGVYGADDDTMNYLNSIRKRYKDNGGNTVSDSASDDENLAIAGSEELVTGAIPGVGIRRISQNAPARFHAQFGGGAPGCGE